MRPMEVFCPFVWKAAALLESVSVTFVANDNHRVANNNSFVFHFFDIVNNHLDSISFLCAADGCHFSRLAWCEK